MLILDQEVKMERENGRKEELKDEQGAKKKNLKAAALEHILA